MNDHDEWFRTAVQSALARLNETAWTDHDRLFDQLEADAERAS